MLDFGLAKAMAGTAPTTTLSNSPTLVSGTMGGAMAMLLVALVSGLGAAALALGAGLALAGLGLGIWLSLRGLARQRLSRTATLDALAWAVPAGVLVACRMRQ